MESKAGFFFSAQKVCERQAKKTSVPLESLPVFFNLGFI